MNSKSNEWLWVGSKILKKKVTESLIKPSKDQELELENKDVTTFLPSLDRNWTVEVFVLMYKQRNLLFEMESIPSKCAMNIIVQLLMWKKMTACEDLVQFWKKFYTWWMLSTSTACCNEMFLAWINWCNKFY